MWNKPPKQLQIPDMRFFIGAQNLSEHAEGAYTGETSLAMLADVGASHGLVGHSERRQYYGETDQSVAAKIAACINYDDASIKPVLCIGETIEERREDRTNDVLTKQLTAVGERIGYDNLLNCVIAYEPVWAIGTGETATPEQAQSAHAFIRGVIAKEAPSVAAQIQILYGGSVKPSNAAELFACEDIDGALVGGASLQVESFFGICAAADSDS
ncbi:MAG: triose-phosphate isomerase [Pseudomonadota bacterium]